MKVLFTEIAVLALLLASLSAQKRAKVMNYNNLTPEQEQVIVHKGTEPPFTGKYLNHKATGIYACTRCRAPLYRSKDKFESNCGWPAFDDQIADAVKQIPDPDGSRTEIICANCGGHLGHIFVGEGFTEKNVRHCVNSISLTFIPAAKDNPEEKPNNIQLPKAYFAGGCFWGVEYWLSKAEGVISVRSGYMGGHLKQPTYRQVCTGNTGHAETVEVQYDPSKISFKELAKLFFEIHDPTQRNRQGPDVGSQYRSAIFYVDPEQKKIAEQLIEQLRKKGFDVVTELKQADVFWPAEKYHQKYYQKTGKEPYCHARTKRF
jgi:peptide methionine sulfoxide reductase msrA/msrB